MLFTFQLFVDLAEFERDIFSDRTKAGLRSGLARGRKGVRPKGLLEQSQNKSRLLKIYFRTILRDTLQLKNRINEKVIVLNKSSKKNLPHKSPLCRFYEKSLSLLFIYFEFFGVNG